MNEQAIETIGRKAPVLAMGTTFRNHLRPAAIAAAAIILVVSAARPATAADPTPNAPTSSTQNVNVVNTPTVNVGTMPAVTLSASSTVKVGNTSANPVPSLDVEKLAR